MGRSDENDEPARDQPRCLEALCERRLVVLRGPSPGIQIQSDRHWRCDRHRATEKMRRLWRRQESYRDGLRRRRSPSLTGDTDSGMQTRLQHAWHLYVIQLGLGTVKDYRDQFIEALKGIRDWHLGALHSLAPASLLSRELRLRSGRFPKRQVRFISALYRCRSIPR